MKLIYKIISGLNICAIVLLLMTGYCGYINPVNHSLWAIMGYGFPGVLAVNALFVLIWLLIRKRMLVLPIAGLLLAYWPIRTYIPFNTESDIPDEALKVLSYNILGFNPTKAPGGEPNPILKYIVDSEADIVCLQEYTTTGEDDTLWVDCEKLYPYRDTLATVGDKGGGHIALFSKYPIVSKEHIPIVSDNNIAGAFMVDVKGKKVCVVNLHLETVGLSEAEKANFSEIVHGKTERDSVKDDSWHLIKKIAASSVIRAPQADAVRHYVRQRLEQCQSLGDGDNADGGIILCGDFNDHPLSYVHRTIEDDLIDCHTASGCGPGYSMHYHSMLFRIDNIMCSSHWQPYLCKVDKSVSLSDHYPIYCYLKLKNE